MLLLSFLLEYKNYDFWGGEKLFEQSLLVRQYFEKRFNLKGHTKNLEDYVNSLDQSIIQSNQILPNHERRGMINQGNFCYTNALIQAICLCKRFCEIYFFELIKYEQEIVAYQQQNS